MWAALRSLGAGAVAFDGLSLRRSKRRRQLAPAMGEKAQRASGGDARVLLAERAGCAVAGVGKDLASAGRLAFIQGGEVGFAHVDFTANLEHVRGAGQRRTGSGASAYRR